MPDLHFVFQITELQMRFFFFKLQNCNIPSFRHRTREIIRQPPGNDESLCPNLMDQEQCRLDVNCFEYMWNVTGWSTCELKPGAVCGEGTMTRILQCKELNGAGSTVDISLCEEVTEKMTCR